MKIVVGAMDERRVKPGEYVIKEGDDGNELFVVEQGTLRCEKVIKGVLTHLKNY